jgi:hypothetical protein
VSHVGVLGLCDRVIVAINDTVQVLGDDSGDLMKLFVVVLAVLSDELGQANGSKVANGHLVFRGILNDLTAEVGALDRAQVLLV